ncbi:Eco57I restriction-modification methylase domain-containing protein [Adhaeribacter radiodurans]|uniref:site-specific DNA-methyltransferase (adenine-specific) n=1 Tax=Adhaeribacter radiodurans TaxID=2745197 RepID=A0A7L7L4J6_9BACT|nr:N-6 DNA methylase [Adhaeribacter radiodurans]QMU27694.1 N-6 DNA methylase [Adhaeribacter radiodurans]
MTTKKKIGSYYTPSILSTFIVKHSFRKIQDKSSIKVLEPSVGDGEFIRALSSVKIPKGLNTIEFFAVEKVECEYLKAKDAASNSTIANITFDIVNQDYLKWQKTNNIKFSLIIGNPPYIKKELLNEEQISICKEIHSSVGLNNSINNIWSSFLFSCSLILDSQGILSFVLPADLLQHKSSEFIRSFLAIHFQRIEIFTFDQLLFESIGQDTILLFCYKKSNDPGLFYSRIKDKDQLTTSNFTLASNNILISTNTKWSHHILDQDEIQFLHNLKNNLSPISNYCISKPGVVTAANSFFIITSETEKNYNLSEFTIPIVQKGQFVNGKLLFTYNDMMNLIESKKPSKFLMLSDEVPDNGSKSLLEYLSIGEEKGLPFRYKCRNRKIWYLIPNVPSKASDAFFFKRSHNYPKFLINSAKAYVTDSAYMVDVKPEFTIESVVVSFYNSLTLTFAELEGRYYGGGVLELTPSEFKGLPIPYTTVTKSYFDTFTEAFRSKINIDEITNLNDNLTLSKLLLCNNDDLIKIRLIKNKLLNKRLRKDF